jgi:hypothetical protein
MQREALSRFFAMALALPALLLAGPGWGTEGMFPLGSVEDLPLRALKKAGADVRGSELVELSRAVVQVAGGGTGSFVSDDGLVVTNHHVAYGCLAALDAMDEHKGILEEGFVAHSREEELPCPGYYLLLLVESRDITDDVRKASKGLEGFHERFEAERAAKGALVEACEKDGRHVCKASSLNGGVREVLSVYTRLLDVRLVYAPEKDVGKYGGDIDNWMYPRHTGDFAFLRAWVAPDQTPAGHQAVNVPYQPEVHLRVSPDGIAKGDFVMVMGYPARTKRFTSSVGTRFYVEEAIPASLETYGPMLKLLEGLAEAYPSVGRRYASLIAGLNNATKYYGELLAGMEKGKVLERKLEGEKALRDGLSAKERERFDAVRADIERIHDSYRPAYRLHYQLGRMAAIGSSALTTAYTIHKWSIEKGKPDADRKDDRFKEKNRYALYEQSDRLELRVDFQAEAAILAYYFRTVLASDGTWKARCVTELLEETRTLLDAVRKEATAAGRTPAEEVRRRFGVVLPEEPEAQAAVLLLARTRVVDWTRNPDATAAAQGLRRSWLDMERPRFEKEVKDPLIDFAARLDRDIVALDEGPAREVEERLVTELHRDWVKALKAPYPDANFTLRLSFGTVEDYTSTATGKTHRYLTSLGEALAKATGKWPFKVPDALIEAAGEDHGRWQDANINDVPINFTSTLDTTGGNSGSPVMDAGGLLVGLLFDGTSESILSDWQYLEKDQRSICMDIRYALFLAEKVHGARELLMELGLAE